jgi:hypothetical protein
MRLIATSLSILMVAFASITFAQSPANSSCIPTDFTKKHDEFVLLNGLIEITQDLDMVKKSMAGFDPYKIKDKEFLPFPYAAMGADFEITPFIYSMVTNGLLDINPDKIQVLGPNMINVRISIPTELAVNVSVQYRITQIDRKWWQPCWTDLIRLRRKCNPSEVGIDLIAAFTNISFDANIQVDMLSCGPQSPEDCEDVTVADLAAMVINNQTLLAVSKGLKRMKYIKFTEMKVSFDEMTNYGFWFHDKGAFINGIINKILDNSQEKINKNGKRYNKFSDKLSRSINEFINNQIQNKTEPLYGHTCYDGVLLK